MVMNFHKMGLILFIAGAIGMTPAEGALSVIRDQLCTMPTGVMAACGAALGNTVGYYARHFKERFTGQDLHPLLKEQAKDVMVKYGAKYLSKDKIDQISLKRSGLEGFSVWSTKNKPVMYIDDCCYDNNQFKIGVLHELGHIYHRDTYREFLKMQFLGIGLPIGMEVTQSMSFGLIGLAGAAVCFRLSSRQAELKADQFAIGCLKDQKDIKALQSGAYYYDELHKYFGDKPRFLNKIGICGSTFKHIQLKYPSIAKALHLVESVHPTHQDRAAKFRQAVQELESEVHQLK